MGIERADLFFLHSQLIEDGHVLYQLDEHRDRLATPLSYFFESVIPAFERLKKEGKIGGWGFALGQESALEAVIASDTPPSAVQCVVNPLNSAGNIAYTTETFDGRKILESCKQNHVPTLAIRAVQAGALTSAMDRDLPDDDADRRDFDRAGGFRQIASEWGEAPARLAHRYALSIEGPSSVILGVKNREELSECVDAESAPRLTDRQCMQIEAACA